MSNFKIGDRVKCIKAHPSSECPLIVGREYIIYGISVCCKTNLDVGIQLPSIVPVGYSINTSNCSSCGFTHENHPVWWLASTRFVKVEEKTNYVKLEIEIEEPIYN